MKNHFLFGVMKSYSFTTVKPIDDYFIYWRSITDPVDKKKYRRFIKNDGNAFYGRIGEEKGWLIPIVEWNQFYSPIFYYSTSEEGKSDNIRITVKSSPFVKIMFLAAVVFLMLYLPLKYLLNRRCPYIPLL